MADYADLALVLDPGLKAQGTQGRAQAFVEHMRRLSAEAGIPQTLSVLGIGPDDLDLLASEAMKQERLLVNNPCPITQADARRLYEAAL